MPLPINYQAVLAKGVFENKTSLAEAFQRMSQSYDPDEENLNTLFGTVLEDTDLLEKLKKSFTLKARQRIAKMVFLPALAVELRHAGDFIYDEIADLLYHHTLLYSNNDNDSWRFPSPNSLLNLGLPASVVPSAVTEVIDDLHYLNNVRTLKDNTEAKELTLDLYNWCSEDCLTTITDEAFAGKWKKGIAVANAANAASTKLVELVKAYVNTILESIYTE